MAQDYKAKLSYLRMAPRKTRLVADLVRGESVESARMQLSFSPKRAAKPFLKLLDSAVANAKNINEEIEESSLFIKKLTVDEGPKLKRFMPVARGSVHEIQKKTSHVTLILSEKELGNDKFKNPNVKTKQKAKEKETATKS